MAESKPKEKFTAKRWTIVDGKKVELESVIFHRRDSKKRRDPKSKKSA